MNRKDIIRMAQKAGFDYSGSELSWESVICTEELESFAALVASAERESCAKWLEDVVDAPNWADVIRAR
jgi:uncharacterized protein YggL (DUF469 family)